VLAVERFGKLDLLRDQGRRADARAGDGARPRSARRPRQLCVPSPATSRASAPAPPSSATAGSRRS